MVVNFNQIDPTKANEQTKQTDNTAVTQELRRIADLKSLDQKTDARAYDKLIQDAKQLEALRNEKGYQAKLQKDKGTKILADLAKDLAALGMEFTPKLSNTANIADDLEGVLGKSALKDDKFEVKDHLTQQAVRRQGGREEKEKEGKDTGKKEDAKKLLSSQDVKETIQDFSNVYAQNILVSSPEAREKLEDARGKLRKKGLSERDVISVERAVKRQFGRQFTSEIQDSFIQHMFSAKNTFDFVVSGRRLNSSYREAIKHGEVTGLTEDKDSVKQQLDRMHESSAEEIKDFIRDAVESKLMERHLKSIDNREEVRKLVELGHRVGFDFTKFLKTWEQKKMDLGLVIMEVEAGISAEAQGQIAIGDVQSGSVGEKHGYEMTKDEEKELLINQLRAEFLKQAVTGDPLATISFVPKVRKLKNGLIKLGLELNDLHRIEQEAKVLARYRTLEQMKDAMLEKATYYELTGSSYALLHNKIKGIASNLERLGLKLDKEQMGFIRDEANRIMHDHTIIELKSAIALLENGSDPSLEQKVPLMVKLIERLRAESGFSHGVGEDIDETIFRHNNGIKNFREDA